jgi:P4 family phage/plasmid primase-like protien
MSMTDWNAINAFIGAVIAWPGPQDPGFANLQYSYHDSRQPDGKIKGKYPVSPGKPFRDLSSMVSYAGWLNGTTNNKDVWFCTSLQAKTKLNKRGNVVGARSAQDALLQKSIWIDADVGNDPKKYPTVDDALRSILTFQKTSGLPQPSAIVFSGTGIQVYWISKKALTPLEWQPFASGLRNMLLANNIKCDAGLTTDIARILRMPGTFNHKYDPPKPVELAPNPPLKLYDFEKALGVLKSWAGPVATTAGPSVAHNLFANGVDPAIFRVKPVLTVAAAGELGLEAGIEIDRLVDFCPIAAHQDRGGCAFYRDAFATGGANHSQPLWNLAVLGTTFMENGNAIAHAISNRHAEYTEVDTQALYDRKMAERHDRGIGYPSCAAIEANGCSACATCPLRSKGKSPLNIRPEPTQGGGTAQQTSNDGKDSADSKDGRLVVPKDDHMGRARIYRKTKRPNLYHYRDDYYDHEGGHYTIIDDDTIRADLYSFLDTCSKEVPRQQKSPVVPTAPNKSSVSETGEALKGKSTVVPFAPNKSSVSETGEALKAIGHVVPTVEQPHWLDGRAGPDPADLICFPNGILNIKSNQFMPPDPMLFTPHGVGFDYDPNAAAPTQWLNFLEEVFDGELDQIGSLQEMFGYCLSSDVSQEKVFMFLGDKRSGKDTIRHTLQSLLSPTVICGPTLDSMGTNFGMSQLIGKQLAVVGDMRLGSKCDKDLLAEHVLKLSGRGLFTIDRKHKSHWTGPLPCKLLLISNEMPTLKDASGALASRMITYRTRTSFYGREDRHLFENKIRPELPAILLWALDGLRRMRQRGPIAEPACSIEAREELAREGSPIMSFVQECLTLDAAAAVDKNVMYSAYLDFAHHSGLRAADKGWFYRNLDTATASKVKAKRVRKGGVDVHIILGARISNPPPKRPMKNEPIVIYATAPAATTQTAEDVGKPSEDDVAFDETVKNSQTSKTARPKGRRKTSPSSTTQSPQQ